MSHRRPSLVLSTALYFTLLTLGFAGVAAASKIKVGSDPEADFSSFRTYSWKKSGTLQSEEVENRILRAADEVLTQKGLRKVELGADPDLWVETRFGRADFLYADLKIEDAWFGYVFLAPAARSRVAGGILLVLSDAANDKAVWGGLSVMEGNTQGALQIMAQRAGKEARKILKKYPALE